MQVRLNDDCMLPVSGWVLFDELGCTQPLSHGLWSFFIMFLTSCLVFRVYFLCHHVKFVVYIPCVYYFYIIIWFSRSFSCVYCLCYGFKFLVCISCFILVVFLFNLCLTVSALWAHIYKHACSSLYWFLIFVCHHPSFPCVYCLVLYCPLGLFSCHRVTSWFWILNLSVVTLIEEVILLMFVAWRELDPDI